MTITVYANLAEEAQKRLDKIAKKAARYSIPFSYTVSEEHPQTVNVYEFDPANHCYAVADTYTVAAVDFTVNCEGLIKSNGWTACAMIEHGKQGNIVTGFGMDAIPEAWYNLPPRCEHCNTNRARSVTFMVKHEDGRVKQVGKACLHEYTGISPATALLWASVEAINGNERDINLAYVYEHGIRMHSVRDILAYAYMDIKKRSYRKSDDINSTRDAVLEMLKVEAMIPEEASARADEIIEWAKSRAEKCARDDRELDKLSREAYEWDEDYNHQYVRNEEAHTRYLDRSREINRSWDAIGDLERNAFPLIKSGWAKPKHLGRLCYLPVAYDKYLEKKQRAEEREASNAASQYIGSVGERITIKVREAAVITSWDTMYGTTWLNKIVDEDGNIYIWKSSSLADIKPGCNLKGTVKEHSEFQGTKQTVLTRCAVK